MAGTTNGIIFDTSEVERLAATLTTVSVSAIPFVVKALTVTARNIKDDARKNVRSSFGHIPHIPHSIDYDLEVGTTGVKAEIGYNRNFVQGNLGHIIEYGLGPNAPQRNLGRALDKNLEDFMTGLQKAVLNGLGG